MAAQSFTNYLAQLAIMLPAIIAAFSFHEFSHALVGTLLGDNTAKRHRRLTLNPIAHIDPLGFICIFLIKFGWAKPVPFNPDNFKHPKFYSILTALAGPCSNFLLAIVAMVCIKYMPFDIMNASVALTLYQILKEFARFNVMLGVFNFLPIPPLDGSRIVVTFLSEEFPEAVLWLDRYALFILFGLFMIPQSQAILSKMIASCYLFLQHLIF